MDMEVDTVATLSVISEQTYKTLFTTASAPRLEASTAQLKTYTGEEIKLLGHQVNKLGLQWNLCIMDTLGPTKGVQIIKVS